MQLAFAGIGRFGKKHRKKLILGAVGTALVSFATAGLVMLKSIEPIHIMKNMYGATFGSSERSETRRSTRLMQRVFQENRRKLNDAPSGRRQRTGNFITDGIVNARLDRVETAIKAQGFEIEYAPDNGKPRAQRAIALRTPDGKLALDKGFTEGRRVINAAADANFKTYLKESPRLTRMFAAAVPGYKTVKRFEFRGMMRHRAGFTSWYFYDKARSGVSNLRERLLGGDRDGGEVKGTVDGGDDEDSDANQQTKNDVDSGNAEVNEAAAAVKADVENGMSKSAAVSKHYKKLLPSGKSTALALVAMGCLAKGYYDSVNDIDLEAYKSRMAIAGTAMAAMSQQQEGSDYSLGAAEEFVSMYYDNETGEQYTQSATWKKATGSKVTGREKDANYDYMYYREGENTFLSTAGKFVSSLGVAANAVCKVTGNFIIGWIVSGVEAIAAGSVKAALAVFGGDQAIDWAMQKLLMLISYPTGIADNGAIFNFAELGLSMELSNIEHTRNMGGQNLSEQQLSELRLAYLNEQAAQDREKGLAWQYLSLDNPRSLSARISSHIPKSPKAALASIAATPRNLFANLRDLLAPSANAEKKTHTLIGSGFKDESIDAIDPIENEKHVVERLGYYCFEGAACDNAKLESAKRMRAHVVCSQYTYYDVYINDEMPHPECLAEPNEDTEAAGVWLLDRNLISGLNQLTSDRNLTSEMTFELVRDIEKCSKLSDFEELKSNGCLPPSAYPDDGDPETSTPSIFDEPLQIETFADSSDYAGDEEAGEEFDPTKIYEDSTGVKCAKNTKDLGIQDGYHGGQKVRIRICAVNNFTGTGAESAGGFGVSGASGKAVVNARVSGAVFAMVAAAREDGVSLVASSAFRTMAHQQALCPCDGVSVAQPGYSNHQMGIAIDFSGIPKDDPAPGTNPVYDWLKKYADKYGFKEYVNEAWHWSPTGG